MSSRTSPATDPVEVPTAPRLAWVDATRGLSVVAVVAFHVVLWHFRELPVAAPVAELWSLINDALGSIRMPVLLAVSGLVLARRIRTGPLRRVLPRAVGDYYLYAVWLGVYALFFAVASQPYLRHRVDGIGQLLGQLVLPSTTLWYLLALAGYIPVLTLLRRVPPWIVLSVLTVLSTAVHWQRSDAQLWLKVPELAVFFAMGVHLSGPLRRLAERASGWLLAAAFVVAAGFAAVGSLVTTRLVDALLFVPRGAVFMVLAVLAVALAVRWEPVALLAVALGRRTLAVYVLHPLLISVLMIVAAGPAGGWIDRLVASPVAAAAYPVAVTALVVLAALLLRRLADRARLGWLFALPSRWVTAVAERPLPALRGRRTGPG